MLDFDGFYAATYYTNFHVSMVSWTLPKSTKKWILADSGYVQYLHLADSDGFRTPAFCVCDKHLWIFGGFRILSSKNTQGVRVKTPWKFIKTIKYFWWLCPGFEGTGLILSMGTFQSGTKAKNQDNRVLRFKDSIWKYGGQIRYSLCPNVGCVFQIKHI